MSTAVVIGGGISGLSAAYYLQKSSKFSKILLLESSKRVGGWMRTEQTSTGAMLEQGPRSIRPVLSQGLSTMLLVEELGLSNDVLIVSKTNKAARNRYIYANGNLNLVPNTAMSMLMKRPPFSRPLLLSLFREMKQPAGSLPDETLYDFVDRRLGRDIAEYLVDPICRGIFAGDCRNLSMKACFPAVLEMEKTHGSLIRAVIAKMKEPKREIPKSPLVKRFLQEQCASYSFSRGLQQFSDTLENACKSSGVEVLKNTPCSKIESEGNKMLVTVNGDTIKADHVISAIYAQNLAKLLPPTFSDLRDNLNKIPAVDVVVVGIELEGKVAMPVDGFGHLLPSSENPGVLGVIYDSCTFPAHDSTSKKGTRFTVMMGGAWYKDLQRTCPAMDTKSLGQLALTSLFDQLNIPASTPFTLNVQILRNCIPQYHLGHTEILGNIFDAVKDRELPLSLVGSSYKGPSVNDCIGNTKLEVERITGMTL